MNDQGFSTGRYPLNALQSNYIPTPISSSKDIYKPIPSSLNLPKLSEKDKYMLGNGQSVQTQQRAGGSGTGVIVLDVPASPDFVFDTLTRFQDYDKFIPTVRSVHIYSSSPTTNEAEFSVSRFLLKMNIRHAIFRDQRVIKFALDETRANIVLREATGLWFVHAPQDRPAGWSRVYFKAKVRASRLVPGPVVDYAASKALARATNWMSPYFTRLYQQQQQMSSSSSSISTSTTVEDVVEYSNIPINDSVSSILTSTSIAMSEATGNATGDELVQISSV